VKLFSNTSLQSRAFMSRMTGILSFFFIKDNKQLRAFNLFKGYI
jgi:hypothetical protein